MRLFETPSNHAQFDIDDLRIAHKAGAVGLTMFATPILQSCSALTSFSTEYQAMMVRGVFGGTIVEQEI
jgi:hypothetical protein